MTNQHDVVEGDIFAPNREVRQLMEQAYLYPYTPQVKGPPEGNAKGLIDTCNEAGYKIIEWYGDMPRVYLHGRVPPIKESEKPLANLLDKLLRNNDVLEVSHVSRGIIGGPYENVPGIIRHVGKPLRDRHVLVVANDLEPIALEACFEAGRQWLHRYQRAGPYSHQLIPLSERLLTLTKERELNFVNSGLGILFYVQFQPHVHQVLDAKHLVSRTIQQQLEKRSISYVTILPDVKNTINQEVHA